MGTYTNLRFKGKLKNEFIEGFEDIAFDGEWEAHNDLIFKKFGELDRSFCIPSGTSSYFPNEWIDKEGVPTNDFKTSYSEETGCWGFQCSLKNYKNTIQEFFLILPYFVEEVHHLEYYYEEDDFSQEYGLINGEIKLINNQFKKYK